MVDLFPMLHRIYYWFQYLQSIAKNTFYQNNTFQQIKYFYGYNLQKFMADLNRNNSINFEPQEEEIHQNPNCNKLKHNQQTAKVSNSVVRQIKNYISASQIITPPQIISSKKYSEAFKCQVHFVKQNLHTSKTTMIRPIYSIFFKNKEKVLHEGACFIYQENNIAYALAQLSNREKFKCKIFIPHFISDEIVEQLMKVGSESLSICHTPESYQECERLIQKEDGVNFDFNLHPIEVMNGAATIAKQILDKQMKKIDVIVIPSMCGAAAGVASYFKQNSQSTKVYAVDVENKDVEEPAKNLKNMILFNEKEDHRVTSSQKRRNYFQGLQQQDRLSQEFVQAGKTSIDGFISVGQKKLAETVVRLYSMGIISQPSGVLAVAALSKIKKTIEGKNVVCILTESRIDFMEIQRARELNSISKGKKFKIRVNIPNRRISIHNLLSKCFLKNEILNIEYVKKTSREENKVIISFESSSQEAFEYSMEKIVALNFKVENITEEED